ncbi:MAG: hypothetical protein WAT70_01760 [Rhizobiaceae bacterium]
MRDGHRNDRAGSATDAETAARLALGYVDSDDIQAPLPRLLSGRDGMILMAAGAILAAFLLF